MEIFQIGKQIKDWLKQFGKKQQDKAKNDEKKQWATVLAEEEEQKQDSGANAMDNKSQIKGGSKQSTSGPGQFLAKDNN